MNELVRQDEVASDIGETTPVSWRASADMTYDQWAAIGRTMQLLGRSLNWWIGDWLVHGETKYGEMYAQALEITGLAEETLSKYKGVAARVPPDIRRVSLSWSHHFAVAYAPQQVREPMLALAERYNMGSRDLKETMRLPLETLQTLIEAAEGDPDMSYIQFARTLNQIRLDAPEQATVNGKAISKREYDVFTEAIESEGYDEREVMPYHEHDEESGRIIKEQVYLEEVFEFFDDSDRPLTHCLADEVAWDGLVIRAALDSNGKPVLLWEKTYA